MPSMTLGGKLTSCLVVLILLINFMGFSSFTIMYRVNEMSGKMSSTFLPQMNLAEKLTTNVLMAQRDFDNYYATKNPVYFDRTEEILSVARGLIEEGFNLCKERQMAEFQAKLESLKRRLGDFDTAVKSLMEANRNIAHWQMQIAKKTRVLITIIPKILDQSNLGLAQNLSNSPPDIERARKNVFRMVSLYQVFSDYAIVRMANQKAQSRGDLMGLKNEFPRIDRIQRTIAQLLDQAGDGGNHDLFGTLNKEFNNLREIFETGIKLETGRDQIRDKMNEIASETLETTINLTEQSFALAQGGARETDQEVLSGGRLLKLGTLFAVLFSIIMGLFLSRNVSAIIKDLQGEIQLGIQTIGSSSTELAAISAQVVDRGASVSEKISTVATAAEEMTANAKLVAQRMVQTSKNLVSINNSTEEMTSTIANIAHNSDKAMTISKEAVNQASIVVNMMKELGRSAKDISVVTEAINSISDQTNMLALNATIEAARAGAAGKGFSVVANEIKELSKQTANATNDIEKRIENIQISTGSAITDIDKIANVIREISQIVTANAAAMEQQSTVTRQIADNLAEASVGVKQTSEQVDETSKVCQSITADVVSVSSSTKELESAGAQVNNSAKDLFQLAQQLENMVKKFHL